MGAQGSSCTAAILSRPCPLWVKSGHSAMSVWCPLYPQKRTLVERVEMSALCQKRTSLHSINSSARRRAEAIDADCKVMCWRGATNLSPLLSEFSSIFAGNRVQLFLCSRLFWCARRSSYFHEKTLPTQEAPQPRVRVIRNRHSQKHAKCSWE